LQEAGIGIAAHVGDVVEGQRPMVRIV